MQTLQYHRELCRGPNDGCREVNPEQGAYFQWLSVTRCLTGSQ